MSYLPFDAGGWTFIIVASSWPSKNTECNLQNWAFHVARYLKPMASLALFELCVKIFHRDVLKNKMEIPVRV